MNNMRGGGGGGGGGMYNNDYGGASNQGFYPPPPPPHQMMGGGQGPMRPLIDSYDQPPGTQTQQVRYKNNKEFFETRSKRSVTVYG
jgi:hypothetical protein